MPTSCRPPVPSVHGKIILNLTEAIENAYEVRENQEEALLASNLNALGFKALVWMLCYVLFL